MHYALGIIALCAGSKKNFRNFPVLVEVSSLLLVGQYRSIYTIKNNMEELLIGLLAPQISAINMYCAVCRAFQ